MADADNAPFVEIPLVGGRAAVVDACDAEQLSKHRWRLHKPFASKTAYAVATVMVGGQRKVVPMHRMILPTSAPVVDHVDGDGLNNRHSNLRPATHNQNMRNRRVQPHTSTFKGVTAHGDSWRVCIRHEGETIHLGSFEREEDAARQYDRAARLLHGRFAKTNEMLGLLPPRRKVA